MNGCFENKMMFAMSMPTCVSAKFAAYNQVLAGRPQCVPLRLPVPVSTSLKNSYKKNHGKIIENSILTIIFPSFSPKKRGFQPFFCRSACIRRSSGCSSSRRRWKSPKPGRWRPLHVASARAAPRGQASGKKKRLAKDID